MLYRYFRLPLTRKPVFSVRSKSQVRRKPEGNRQPNRHPDQVVRQTVRSPFQSPTTLISSPAIQNNQACRLIPTSRNPKYLSTIEPASLQPGAPSPGPRGYRSPQTKKNSALSPKIPACTAYDRPGKTSLCTSVKPEGSSTGGSTNFVTRFSGEN